MTWALVIFTMMADTRITTIPMDSLTLCEAAGSQMAKARDGWGRPLVFHYECVKVK